MFGKKVFVAQFAESGAITSVEYSSNTGSAQALNVLNAAAQAPEQITAQKMAEIKADADLIAQQQRLVQCLADRSQCK
jgi:hypothetical protein